MEMRRTEVVKELIYKAEELDHFVHGRIVKNADGSFFGDISHHYKPTADAGTVCCPSLANYPTLLGAEAELDRYISFFKHEFHVERNPNY